jgi:hypothetical protein
MAWFAITGGGEVIMVIHACGIVPSLRWITGLVCVLLGRWARSSGRRRVDPAAADGSTSPSYATPAW